MKQRILLRSGRADAFMALGEGGRPVFRSAGQLREAMRRRTDGYADHLAIPQSNESGTTLDWYSPLPGSVVPWAAATETERESARQQLRGLMGQVERLAGAAGPMDQDANEAAGDKPLFSSLLRRAVYFPDENFVYLVGGRAVLTFWGFLHHGADQGIDPLLCLAAAPPAASVAPATAPAVAPVPAAPAPVVPPLAAGPVPVVGRGWIYYWSRYGWRLLALLALLAILLFGLRWCASPSLPGSGLNLGSALSGGPGWLPAWLKPSGLSLSSGSVSLPSGGAALSSPDLAGAGRTPGADPSPDTGAAPPMPAPAPATAAGPLEPPAAPGMPDAPEPAAGPASQDAPDAPVAPPVVPQVSSSGAAPVAASLVVPPNALQSGQLGFLDGQWAAKMGVQDSQTGKPVQLQYQLHDGAGRVRVKRGDGVQCEAPVTASAVNGQLILNTEAAAQCSDNAAYDMPKIICDPGAAGGAARCAGVYGTDAFPLILQQSD